MPQLAALHGMVFEEMAHDMLARGGTFDCRELTDDNNQTYYRSRLIGSIFSTIILVILGMNNTTGGQALKMQGLLMQFMMLNGYSR